MGYLLFVLTLPASLNERDLETLSGSGPYSRLPQRRAGRGIGPSMARSTSSKV